MLIALVRPRLQDWPRLLALARQVLGAIGSGGPRSLAKWILDEYFGSHTLSSLSPFTATEMDLHDDADVANASGLERERFIWESQKADDVDDVWSAARFCIDLLRTHAEIRRRFPDALSAGCSGPFAQWIQTEGAALFSLSPDGSAAIRRALGAGLSKYIRQLYLVRDDLQRAFPLALTPAGRRPFFRWILDDGRILPGVRLEIIWWFFVETAENPAAELVQTFLFRPEWQRIFPEGVNVFGRAQLGKWLAETYGLAGEWTNPASWPVVGTAAEQIRLAHVLRPEWRRAYPDPFKTAQTAEVFLKWLTTPASGLSADTIAWCRSLDQAAVARELVSGGVNILGHFCYASGLRQSVESITEGMKRVGLGISLRDIWQDRHDEARHAEFSGLEFYDTTIIHTQPEPYFETSYVRAGLQPRNRRTYRIGYWYWEFEEIPKSWAVHAAQLDELWVATKFVASAMRQRLDLPVYQLMPGVELPNFAQRPRAAFGLPENRFVFLFVFSMMSVMERKNPLGLIRAYSQAFGNDDRTLLVVKTSYGNLHPDLLAELHAAAADNSIIVIDAIYSQQEILSLVAAADCYVSLHRSEGWGLTMAEAMLLGKPTIATGYSGNIDFMTPTNSLLVDYQLVTLERDYPPYITGSHWAEPSIDHAAQLMRRVFENQRWAQELGQMATTELGKQLSIVAAGRRMAARLDEIRALASDRNAFKRVSGGPAESISM